ncbi:peptidase domain-containing ABC transporter [Stenotrophomonas pavanii]|uniref:peptidase domain-containing ABC transporter n=1 Tax=Stenotrophomonas pavanii TaxID=487698 RepID=UPI000892340D|nr:peptidase domain-containing ABC transporter [Stenotrophomonas pavanii]PNY70817.1 peptidase domain-containing ABC transporter [Stenotrophomonas pavanii]SDK41014.1 ATP-binding cassette, subfamily B, RaxB [Stenotrophomonas pavanii]
MEPIIQSESAECGLACLAMIADHHGNRIGLRELRRQHPASLKGATLAQVMKVAARLGLGSRAVRLDLEHLSQLRLPAVLHWDLNHFVVLQNVSRRGVVVLDPAFGRRVLKIDEFSKHFTGIALELAPTTDFKRAPIAPAIAISDLTGRIDGLWRSLGLILLLSCALQIFVLLAPFFMQWTVDQVLISADSNLLTVLGVGFGLALLIQVMIGLVRGSAVIYLSNRLGVQWATNVFSHLLKLPLDFFERRHLGDITSRMSSVQAIQRTLTTSFVEAIVDGLMASVTLLMMFMYSWKLALITLLAVCLYMAARTLAFKALRTGSEQQLIASARQQSYLIESIRGIQSIKIGGRETSRKLSYSNLLQDTTNSDVWLARYGLAFTSSNQLIFGLERIAVIWIGALLAMQNVFSVGMLVAYLAYKDMFAQRIASLIDKSVEFRMLRLHGERLGEIALTPPEESSDAYLTETLPEDLSIECKGLGFRYSPDEPWVIKDCNLRIAQGESVAITGPSGCGKTTLLKVLLGLLPPTEGTVLVGGVPLEKISAESYRNAVGAVMQDDQLFAGSLADNISFGEDTPDESSVYRAANLAAIHAEIMAMPMGYHTLIGDMGTSLSGGQKQRVILARALYSNPRILFLDEATSHLDVGRERLVNTSIHGLDLTRVIIAHRPETIASADRVLLMTNGQLIDLPDQARDARIDEILESGHAA